MCTPYGKRSSLLIEIFAPQKEKRKKLILSEISLQIFLISLTITDFKSVVLFSFRLPSIIFIYKKKRVFSCYFDELSLSTCYNRNY